MLRYFNEKLITPDQWSSWSLSKKQEGKTIATLNGSFDLLHAGHLHILFQASLQADLLIVALNSDLSIQQYKSKDRPIIPLKERMALIAAIQCVDFVTWFDETTPEQFILSIKPTVHVNGAEYGDQCIESPTVQSVGALLHLVDRIPGLATSDILDKILQTQRV